MTDQEQIDQVVANAMALNPRPIAIEAQWDGDTTGWFIRMSAITTDSQSHHLGFLRFGSDIRLFEGVVPPWPEAGAAVKLGAQLARQLNAEFYFPSPEYPDIDCPSWIDSEDVRIPKSE